MRLAREAGVSQGVLFQRFGTKDELFFAAMRLPAPDFDESLRRAETASPREGLVELAIAAGEYLREQMPIVLVVLSHPIFRRDSPSPGELLNGALPLRRGLERFITERIAHPNPRAATELLVSTLLADAFHRAIGIPVERDEKAWLDGLLTAMGIG